jgi:hypothetical protein
MAGAGVTAGADTASAEAMAIVADTAIAEPTAAIAADTRDADTLAEHAVV